MNKSIEHIGIVMGRIPHGVRLGLEKSIGDGVQIDVRTLMFTIHNSYFAETSFTGSGLVSELQSCKDFYAPNG